MLRLILPVAVLICLASDALAQWVGEESLLITSITGGAEGKLLNRVTKIAGKLRQPLIFMALTASMGAFAQSYPGANNSIPQGSEPSPNDPPVWSATPDPVCIEGQVSSEPYSQWVSDPEADPLTFVNETGCTLPTGVTIDNVSKEIDCAGTTVAGTTTSCVHSADDGTNSPVNSPSFSINVAESPPEWPTQGAVSYTCVNTTNCPPAIRDRNPAAASVVAAGRGHGMDTRHAYCQWNVDAQTGTQPDILHVTSTAATGAGTLHEHWVNGTGPRIIVFDRGGVIEMDRDWEIEEPCSYVAAQTAPEQVILTGPNDDNHRVFISSDDHFVRHMIFWYQGPIVTGNENALHVNDKQVAQLGPDFGDIVLDHVFIGGGIDQNLLTYYDIHNLTLVDSIVSYPRGAITLSHAFNHNIGGNSNDPTDVEDADFISLIGNVYGFAQQRNPSIRAQNVTIANHLNYNREFYGVQLGGKDTAVQHKIDIVGLWEKRGNDHNAAVKPIYIVNGNSRPMTTNSEVYISDTRAVEAGADEWDVVTESDSTKQEGDVRVGTATSSWPTGLVAAPNLAVDEQEYLELMTEFVGPRPNDRITFLTTFINHVKNGTGSITDDYTDPTVTSTLSTYSEPGTPHAAGVEAGRTIIEEDLADKAQALLD